MYIPFLRFPSYLGHHRALSRGPMLYSRFSLVIYFIHSSMFLPGESHGQGSLVGCSPWGFEEWDMTERLHFDFSLSCFGERNGNPLQCSCLENPRDSGAWWATVYGVAQSQTRLKRLSSSSSSICQPQTPNSSSLLPSIH